MSDDIPAMMARRRRTVASIQQAVAAHYRLRADDLTGRDRHSIIAGPRAVAMYLARKHTVQSYPELGRRFGNRDHSTVFHLVDKTTKRRRVDQRLAADIRAIEAVL
jgi:chromosomal replication initiator protein